MLNFVCKRRDTSQVPIMSADEMDLYAEKLVRDYRSVLLKEPKPFPYEDFLENYLGACLAYQDLRDPTDHGEILGLTAFEDDSVVVYDEPTGKHCLLPVNGGTIVLQVNLTEGDQEGRLRFTALHEAAHFWCHGGYFNKSQTREPRQKAILCRGTSVEMGDNYRRNTPEEWMEYQADYMASAIAMPKKLFIETAKSVVEGLGFEKLPLKAGQNEEDDWFIKEEFPSILADAFGVSKKAARIRLRRFRLI